MCVCVCIYECVYVCVCVCAFAHTCLCVYSLLSASARDEPTTLRNGNCSASVLIGNWMSDSSFT